MNHPRRKNILAKVILAVALGIIALLVIPACLFIGLIGIVWSAADAVLKVLDH
ncbi:MAG: hypothetical protein IJO45_03565 [Oscillospiraceae bacterium]|nr:hypothetical protein [Oscillospiraceae bacterium]